MTGSRAKFGKG